MPAMRVRRWTTVLGAVALLAVTAAGAGTAQAAVTDADQGRVGVVETDLEVGAQLEAIGKVRIGGATLAKGSKVGVFALSRRDGQVERVDVQLADGYVVRDVAVSTIRKRFRQIARDAE